tara:strand:- start:437 stop:805 length:369 start_codon:yes stop_codon:yes gene_type:complete
MDKKKGMILGGIGLVVVILLVFLLSGSSTRDMIIGKWKYDGDSIEFIADGTVKDDSPPSRSKTWNLSDDEKTLIIHEVKVDRKGKIKNGGKTKAFKLISVSDDELCVRNEHNKERCYSKVLD